MSTNSIATVQTPLTANEADKRLFDLTQELYQSANREFIPMKGWVFVRVLDKEYKSSGGIIIAADKQNKPVHEGIVICTWQPYTEEKSVRTEGGTTITKYVQHKSELAPGDHVLFDHWAGAPIEGFTDKYWRVVKEDGSDRQKGGIFAVVDYQEKELSPHGELVKLLDDLIADPDLTTEEIRLVASKIEDKFLLVDRDAGSVTMSGR